MKIRVQVKNIIYGYVYQYFLSYYITNIDVIKHILEDLLQGKRLYGLKRGLFFTILDIFYFVT